MDSVGEGAYPERRLEVFAKVWRSGKGASIVAFLRVAKARSPPCPSNFLKYFMRFSLDGTDPMTTSDSWEAHYNI